jgi:hypothetical protein
MSDQDGGGLAAAGPPSLSGPRDTPGLSNYGASLARIWHNEGVKHAAPEPERRSWFRRRRPEATTTVVDVRDEPLPNDPESVIARLARLRDAGLITNAEFERERASLLGDPATIDLRQIDPRALDADVRASLEQGIPQQHHGVPQQRTDG